MMTNYNVYPHLYPQVMKKIFKKPRQNQAKTIADICIWMSDPVKFNEMQDGFIKNKNTFIQVEVLRM